MRGNTLVTGGSDGSVRVWSLEKMAPIHRLAAHDNSVTSLQFDETRIVSGGSDGRVKVWDLKTGQLVRELSTPADAVWRVAFEEEKCVIMASRQNRTMMEVCFPWFFIIARHKLISYRYGHSPLLMTSSSPAPLTHRWMLNEALKVPSSVALPRGHSVLSITEILVSHRMTNA